MRSSLQEHNTHRGSCEGEHRGGHGLHHELEGTHCHSIE